jgi:hypothetical protein
VSTTSARRSLFERLGHRREPPPPHHLFFGGLAFAIAGTGPSGSVRCGVSWVSLIPLWTFGTAEGCGAAAFRGATELTHVNDINTQASNNGLVIRMALRCQSVIARMI